MSDVINNERLIQKANAYNIDISNIIEKLNLYAKLLVDYNKKVNLTALTLPEDIEDKHFIDSLILANCNEIKGSIIDVGTGAGFPGIIIKLFKPDTAITLLEPTGKRIDFLKFVCSELAITGNVFFAKERAEEAARKSYRESYNVATARAVANMNVLCEYCLPLVKKGGHFIAMKGANGYHEALGANSAVKKLGGELVINKQKNIYTLPQGDKRILIVCKKISQTPSTYPRNGGKISKSPLN